MFSKLRFTGERAFIVGSALRCLCHQLSYMNKLLCVCREKFFKIRVEMIRDFPLLGLQSDLLVV